ncbi:hypothetical protein [Streptomyces axinellae]
MVRTPAALPPGAAVRSTGAALTPVLTAKGPEAAALHPAGTPGPFAL